MTSPALMKWAPALIAAAVLTTFAVIGSTLSCGFSMVSSLVSTESSAVKLPTAPDGLNVTPPSKPVVLDNSDTSAVPARAVDGLPASATFSSPGSPPPGRSSSPATSA